MEENEERTKASKRTSLMRDLEDIVGVRFAQSGKARAELT